METPPTKRSWTTRRGHALCARLRRARLPARAASPRALRLPAGRQRCAGRHWGGRFQSAPHGACRRRALATLAPPLRGSSSRVQSWPPPRAQVSFEDYPEAGMSALKYYTIQSYTK